MNYEDTLDRLKDIKIEDYIWVIYIGIIILSYYSNSLEKDYLLNNNQISKDKYRSIMVIIFSILIVVYFYFMVDAYNSYIKNKSNELLYLSLIASILIFISGLIFLYIAVKDKDLNVELAFN